MAFTDPPLTTLRQPVRAMSDAASRALLDAIGGRVAPRREYLFRPELVVRQSTGPVPPPGPAGPTTTEPATRRRSRGASPARSRR
jgi:alanine racemase